MKDLEIKKDGSVYIQPDNLFVENQMEGHHIVAKHHPETAINSTILCNPGIYPIPYLKWEVVGIDETGNSNCSDDNVVQEVAVISLPEPDKEKRKKLLIEMMQEDEKNGMYDKSDNELIAEFMGVREKTGNYDNYGSNAPYWFTETELFRSRSFTVPDRSFFEFLEHCKYHTSWDWLMPVVEKISRIRCAPLSDVDYSTYHPRTFGMLDTEGKPMVRIHAHGVFTGDTLIQAAYDAVVDFVKLYNQQSK